MAVPNQNQKSTKSEVKAMTNSEMYVEGNQAHITIKDLTKRIRLSSTGVSYIVAGGDGNLALPEPFSHVKLILTVITKEGIDK